MRERIDSDELRKLVALARDDLSFFSNRGKKPRERWVLSKWLAHAGISPASVTEDEGPDFIVDGVYVEVAEVLEPGRKRGAEYKEDVEELSEGKLPQPKPRVGLRSVVDEADSWIIDAIAKKAALYGKTAQSWLLLVYADYTWSDRTDWARLRSRAAAEVEIFREIHVITGDGNHAERIK